MNKTTLLSILFSLISFVSFAQPYNPSVFQHTVSQLGYGTVTGSWNFANGEFTVAGTNVSIGQISGSKIVNHSFALTNDTAYLTPRMFNAVGDGSTDDTTALYNTFSALNTGRIRVLDGLGKTYKITQPMPEITVKDVTVQNIDIAVANTASNTYLSVHCIGDGNNVVFSHVSLRQIGGEPQPECIGLRIGNYTGGGYGFNALVQNCYWTNWWRGVQCQDMAQMTFDHCAFFLNYSNGIHIAKGIAGADMIKVLWCSSDNGTYENGPPSNGKIRTNQICYQQDAHAWCVKFQGNNIGAAKQAVLISPSVDYCMFEMDGDSDGSFYMSDPNTCPFEFWNTYVTIRNTRLDQSWAGSGASNHLATIGIYATNALDFRLCKFENLYGGTTFDVAGPFQVGSPKILSYNAPFIMYYRTNLTDARITNQFLYPSGNTEILSKYTFDLFPPCYTGAAWFSANENNRFGYEMGGSGSGFIGFKRIYLQGNNADMSYLYGGMDVSWELYVQLPAKITNNATFGFSTDKVTGVNFYGQFYLNLTNTASARQYQVVKGTNYIWQASASDVTAMPWIDGLTPGIQVFGGKITLMPHQ